MPTEIFNDGASIRIYSNNNTLLISKLQIKTIDTVRNDTVRIDIGEGPLKNIYIRFDDVATPSGFINADDLRDYINNLLTTSVSGGATEVKQDTEIRLLTQIAGLLDNIKTIVGRYTGGGGKDTPQRIDESNPSEIYYGYADAGAGTSQPVWGIRRATRTKDVTIYTWADGNENFDNVWDDRLTLNYLPI
jgi:hypothetical protein